MILVFLVGPKKYLQLYPPSRNNASHGCCCCLPERTRRVKKIIFPHGQTLQLTGQNLGRVFNFRSGHLHVAHLWCYQVKLPNLKLKTRPKQPLGYLPLDFAFPIFLLSLKTSAKHFRNKRRKNAAD